MQSNEMAMPLKRTLFFTVLCLSTLVFWINVSVYMDDVFIYLRVTRNILDGTGPVFNPGDTHFPVTGPLWVFLLALFRFLLPFIDLVTLSKLLYVVFLGFASWFGFLLFRGKAGYWAAAVTIPVFFNYITMSYAGGEIALAYCAIFATLWAYTLKKNYILTGLFLAAAYLARGELVLLGLPIGLHYLFFAIKEKRKFSVSALEIGKMATGFLALAGVWHLYYAIQFQSLFPTTLQTKIVQGKSGMWQMYYQWGRKYAAQILNGHAYLLVFLAFGLYYFKFLAIALLAYTVIHYYLYQFLTIPHYHWYFYDFFLLIPLFIILGISGFVRFSRRWTDEQKTTGKTANKPLRGGIETAGAILIILSLVVTTHVLKTGRYRNDNRKTRYMEAAERLKTVTAENDIVLTHEIGIIGFYLENTIIRDLNGIASPGVTVDNINDTTHFIAQYSPKFVIYPAWLPQERNLKYFWTGNRLAVYEKRFAIENQNKKDTVFQYKETLRAAPYIRFLETLRKNAVFVSGNEYEIIANGPGYFLSTPVPFCSHLILPPGVKGVSVGFGILPGENIGAAVIFSIYSVNGANRRLVFEKKLDVSLPHATAMEKAVISFKPKEFERLEFSVTADKKNVKGKMPKPYWGRVRFVL